MEIPWKLQQLLVAVLGEDRVKNRREFRPDFSERAFRASLALPGLARVEIAEESQIVKWFLEQARPPFMLPLPGVLPRAQQLVREHPEWRDSILAQARQISASGLPVYHTQLAPMNADFPWHDLSRGPYGDTLYLSRPQRFGFAPVLAQAALFDPGCLEQLDNALASWQAWAQRCPYRWPYNSNHAVIYRLIALSICWTFIGAIYQSERDSTAGRVLFRILSILRNDVAYLAPRLGHSHGNNHLLADYFGGWLIKFLFPELIPEGFDLSHYQEHWEQELLHQFYPDGGCFEHAVHYQEHGCEFALIYALHVEPAAMGPLVHERIASMLYFLARLAGAEGRPWPLGDTTEDTLLPLDPTPGWSAHAIARAHDTLYPSRAQGLARGDDQKSYWLLSQVADREEDGAAKPGGFAGFKQAGFAHWMQPSGGQLLFRTGVAPGAPFIKGHMHADILSLYWRLQGVDVLAASGTYSYRFAETDEGNYRDYFCGPWSHSTLLVDSQDPLGKLDRGFRRHDNGLRVQTSVHDADPAIQLCAARVASNNVYHDLQRRVVQFAEGWSLVQDVLSTEQLAQEVVTLWQFGPQVQARVCAAGDIKVASNGTDLAWLRPLHATATDIVHGAVSPPRGWHSERYGEKQAVDAALSRAVDVTDSQLWILSPVGVVEDIAVLSEQSGGQVIEVTAAGARYRLAFGCDAGEPVLQVDVTGADTGAARALQLPLDCHVSERGQ